MKKATLFLVMFTLITTLSACNNTQETEIKETKDKTTNEINKATESLTGAMEKETVENKVEKITTTYKNPKGDVNVDISYSLDADGKIATMEVTSDNYDLTNFNKEVQSQVIGKTTGEVNVYVAGESLTNDAFNKAVKENISTDTKKKVVKNTEVSIKKSEDFTDERDGKVYPTVQIGEQVWMTKNLAHKTKDSFAYKNDEKNVEKYGRLYLFEDLKNAVPKGWHVATDAEWKTLEKNLGMSNKDIEISDYMTARGTTEGNDIKAGGKTMLDFPMAGFRRDDGKYEGADDDKERPRTYIWVNTKVNGQEGEEVFRRRAEKDSTNLYRFTNPTAGFAISVRLIKD